MKFDDLRDANKSRCERMFHDIEAWKPWDWSNAMAGEVGEMCAELMSLTTAIAAKSGEVCNLTKKMARVWPANTYYTNYNKPEDQRIEELAKRAMKELADMVIYADLLAQRLQQNLGEAVRDKFNEKSIDIGSDVRL